MAGGGTVEKSLPASHTKIRTIPTTRTISLRLPQHLLDSIKAAANARDVPYQSLIKVWLQEKLHSH
jgi:predicted DNA binding CopG/RHH family protein